MINLYKENETNFKHNEFVLSECIVCDVTESLDNTFEVDIEYPVNDSKNISKELVTGAYIKVPSFDDREPQLFCLRRPKTTLSRVIGYGQHVAISKLSKNMIKDTNIVNKNRKEAIQQVLSNTMYPHSFKVGNKDTSNTQNNLRIVRYSPLTGIVGEKKNTIVNVYGGELILDNFTLDMVDSRGEDTGLVIAYRKNLTGVELTTDDLELMTEIIPIGNNDLLLPEYSIKSPNFNNYTDAYVKEVKVDIGVVEPSYDSNELLTNADEVFTMEQCYQYMRQYIANMYIYEKVDQLNFNLVVNFVQLQDTEEYKNYIGLAKVKQVGDIVTIRHEILRLNLKGRVQKIKRDILTGRIKEIEIGFNKKSIVDIVKETKRQVATITESVTTVAQKVVDTKEKLTTEIKEAKKITSDLKVVMEAKDNEIELSITNLENNTIAQFLIQDGKISEKVSNDTFNSYRTQTSDLIDQKVSRGTDFSTQIEQSATAIIQTIQGVTDNKTIFDSSGFRVVRGGFVFEDDNGDEILAAYSGGGIQIGDNSWSTSMTKSRVYFGNKQLASWFQLSYIDINTSLDMGYENIYTEGTIYTADLEVSGSKNCVQETANYGRRLINAYETAGYYLGDIGSGIIKNGECLIVIDPIFQECINTNVEYQVNIFEYKNIGSITDIERYPNYFIVKGNIDEIEFGWELKAKRKGYEGSRLELSKK